MEGGLGKEIATSLAKLIALNAVSIFCVFLLTMPNMIYEYLEEINREIQKIINEKTSFKKEVEERQNWRRH
jgi:hypothetical protein